MKTKFRIASVKKRTNDRLLILGHRLTGALLNILDHLAPERAVHLAYALFGKTQRYAPRPLELDWISRAQQHTLWQQGKKLQAFSWGMGPTILLVHGWNGRGTQLAGYISPLLERGFRVVAMDAMSHGHSEGRHTNLFDFSESVRLVGRAFGPLAGVIAHSMGGAATTLALDSGMQAKHLVFIAPPVNPMNWVHQFAKSLGLSKRMVRHFNSYLARRFGKPWQQVQTFELQSKMKNKLLIFHDQEDKEISYRNSQEQIKHWPRSRLILTKGLGHFRILQDTQVISQAIGFLTETEQKITRRKSSRGGKSYEKNNEKIKRTVHSVMDTPIPA